MSWRHPLQKLFALEFQHMANRAIRNEMRREFQRALNAFDILEQEAFDKKASRQAAALPEKESEQKQISQRRDPYYAFDNFDEDFFRDRSPFGQLDRALSSFDSFDARFNSLQSLADQIKQDMDKRFKESAEILEGKDEYPKLADPDNTTYFRRIETNDNGKVKVKTISKKPGSDWETKIEEYEGGKPVLEAEGKQAIEGKESKEASPKQSLEGKKDVKKESVGQQAPSSKSSSSGSTSASA